MSERYRSSRDGSDPGGQPGNPAPMRLLELRRDGQNLIDEADQAIDRLLSGPGNSTQWLAASRQEGGQ